MKLKKREKRNEISNAMTLDLEGDERKGLVDEDVIYGCSSIIGARKNQQDAYFAERNFEKNQTIGIVCDGMGGLEGGATASKTALDYVVHRMHGIEEEKEINHILENIAEEADKIVSELTDENGMHMRAGTTLAAAMIRGRRLHWVSVGDSKIFILKNGALQCVTDQHNYGFMAEKRKNHRNFVFDPNVRQDALVSYIGAGTLPYIDISPDNVLLDDKDIVLICSDGLYNALSEEEIRRIMLKEGVSVNSISDQLTSEIIAKNLKGQDNATAVVLQYRNNINHKLLQI